MSSTHKTEPAVQREQLLDAERRANEKQPRNFKDDALTDKVVRVEPNGSGPTPTQSFDTDVDRTSAAAVSQR